MVWLLVVAALLLGIGLVPMVRWVGSRYTPWLVIRIERRGHARSRAIHASGADTTTSPTLSASEFAFAGGSVALDTEDLVTSARSRSGSEVEAADTSDDGARIAYVSAWVRGPDQRLDLDSGPITIGSALDAGLKVKGPEEHAIISFSEGVGFVTNLTDKPVTLGSVNVSSTGVPITPETSILRLADTAFDLAATATRPVDGQGLGLRLRQSGTHRLAWAGAARVLAISSISGEDEVPLRCHEVAVQTFTGSGEMSARWALDAALADSPQEETCAVVGHLTEGHTETVSIATNSHGLRCQFREGDTRYEVEPELKVGGLLVLNSAILSNELLLEMFDTDGSEIAQAVIWFAAAASPKVGAPESDGERGDKDDQLSDA